MIFSFFIQQNLLLTRSLVEGSAGLPLGSLMLERQREGKDFLALFLSLSEWVLSNRYS